MAPIVSSQANAQSIPSNSATSRWALTLFMISVFILFYHLGAPALFELDEGRNAEKAREILLTQDWVTPDEDFMGVLDKPNFFYWLIALWENHGRPQLIISNTLWTSLSLSSLYA